MLAARTSITSPRSHERGVVVIWALLSAFLVAGIILSATEEMRAVDAAARFEFTAQGHAEEIAQAGLVEAYAWFRRQPVQPVAAFAPQDAQGRSIVTVDLGLVESVAPETFGRAGLERFEADSEAAPIQVVSESIRKVLNVVPAPIVRSSAAVASQVDTQDVTRGLVRVFEIAPGLVGRYTVAYGTQDEPFTDANLNGHYDEGEPYVDADGDGRWTRADGTRDISSKRGAAGQGTIWALTSRGEVFRYADPEVHLGVGVNQRLAVTTWSTEIRRLNVVSPSAAALCVRRGSDASLGSRVRVRGDTAIAYGALTGTPQVSGASLEGPLSGVPDYRDRVQDVFGVSWPELQGMAELSTDDPVGGVPKELKSYSLNVVTGNITFTRERPLRGLAMLAVKGNMEIRSGSNSFFNGVLYVDGDLTIDAPATLRGVIIVTGKVTLRGSGGDYTEILQDAPVIADLLVKVGQYRPSKAHFRLGSTIDARGPSGAAAASSGAAAAAAEID